MNEKLRRFAARIEGAAGILILFAALRSDSDLPYWEVPLLCGTILCIFGLTLTWLCGSDGLHFRRRLFRTKPTVRPAPAEARVIPFPKAG